MKTYYLLLLCFCAVFNVIAADKTTNELPLLKEKIHRAILKFEHTDKKLWSYQIARFEDEEGDVSSSIEQHSPLDNKPWSLIEIDGELPTEKQIKSFAKKKQKQSDVVKKEQHIQLPLRELIHHESLSLVSIDDKYIVMAFDVHLNKLGDDSIGKLQGQLSYQKDNQFIEKISIWNNAEFSPMFTANITDLAITFTFFHINGAVLTKQNEMTMKGSFAYFTEINETSLDSFSDYLYRGNTIK